MIGATTDISAELVVETPLHIGTGDFPAVPGLGGSSDETRVAMVALDYRGMPYIPGSSLKGSLKRYASAEASELFGSGPETGSSEGGQAVFWPAFFASKQEAPDAPYAHLRMPELEHSFEDAGLFVESRTAINKEKGVAERARLFHTVMVVPGTRFKFELSVSEGSPAQPTLDLLGELSSGLISLGRSSRHGNGIVRLDLDTLAVKGSADETETWRREICERRSRFEEIGIGLTADGPYLIIDHGQSAQKDAEAPQIAALKDFQKDLPRLTGTSLGGALRSAFAGYLQDIGEDGGDNVDRMYDGDYADLTPTERIFGVTGWRGVAEIRRIIPGASCHRQTIMSVKSDRFTGGVVDNALFGTQAWIGSSFDVQFILKPRAGFEDSELWSQDRVRVLDFLTFLQDDVWGGLMLGHGSGKGYGWFKIEVSE